LYAIDKALLRPGRFHELIHIGLPGYQDRQALFKLFTSRMPLVNDVTNDQLEQLQSLVTQAQHDADSSNDSDVNSISTNNNKDITALLASDQLSGGMTCADIEVT
jgi:SpoVK/Ycf46/Vps4 family AAA+-type ATPase